MTALDDFPDIHSFLGVDLKTGSLIIAALCIVHPMAYGCTFFLPMSYLLVTIWVMVVLFFASSVALFYGVTTDDALICTIWIWYAVVFQTVMMMMMILLILVFATRKQRNRILAVFLAMLWYLLTIYFILVVNSHRKRLVGGVGTNGTTIISSPREEDGASEAPTTERDDLVPNKLTDKTHVLY